MTCGSLILKVVTGSAEVILEDGLSSVSIPAGGKAEIGDDGSGGHTVANLGTTPITVTVDGVEATVDPGETSTVEAWDFQGFFWPIDNPPKVNKWLAGLPVPLSWRVLDASGAPVTDLSSAAITVSNINCTTGADLGELGTGGFDWRSQQPQKGLLQPELEDAEDLRGHVQGDAPRHRGRRHARDAYFKFSK